LIVKLRCLGGCGTDQEFNLPAGVLPPPNYLCRDCSADKSMVDDVEDIGRTRLARKVEWQRAGRIVEYVNGTSGRQDGYVIYVRKKDRASKFRRRNGFTQQAWHARVDELGWRCSFCGRGVTKITVLRWSVDGSKKLASQVPVCRACQCKKIAQGGPLSEHYTSEGNKIAA
jgi:hypothetical protein